MKITHYMARMRLEDGGVVRAVLDLCAALAQKGHEVTLLTCDPRDVPVDWENIRVIALSRRGRLPMLSRVARRAAEEAIQRSDVVHLHVPWDPLCSQLARLARRAHRPYILSIHGMLDDWTMLQKGMKKRLYLKLGGRRLLEQAAAVHCTAQAEMEQSRRWYPRGRPIVLPLAMDLAPFQDLPGPVLARETFPPASTDEPILLFLSRVHPKKGVEHLIDAMALLQERGIQHRLLIAGTGEAEYLARLRTRARERGVGEHVHFVGFVTGLEKVSLLQAADVFMLPTSQENWGIVLLEALACETPVVTTRGVDIWPELESSGGARIVAANAASLADEAESLLRDPSRRYAMGRKGREWVMRTLEPQRVVAGYERAYRETVGMRAAPDARAVMGSQRSIHERSRS